MKLAGVVSLIFLAWSSLLAGQNPPQGSTPAKPAQDYSGMYSFLQDGEFVQITVEDEGRVTGFDGTKLTFTTDTVHGVWYEFKGTVERGEGKTLSDEAYYVVKGTLKEYRTDANKAVTSQSRQVTFKSFPREV
jgi:hypothetical protein